MRTDCICQMIAEELVYCPVLFPICTAGTCVLAAQHGLQHHKRWSLSCITGLLLRMALCYQLCGSGLGVGRVDQGGDGGRREVCQCGRGQLFAAPISCAFFRLTCTCVTQRSGADLGRSIGQQGAHVVIRLWITLYHKMQCTPQWHSTLVQVAEDRVGALVSSDFPMKILLDCFVTKNTFKTFSQWNKSYSALQEFHTWFMSCVLTELCTK